MKTVQQARLLPWTAHVPDGWTVKRLKYAVQLVTENGEARESHLPFTGLEDIESWTGRLLATEQASASVGVLGSRFHPGDVLFGKLRPYLAKVYRAGRNGMCTGELLVMRPKILSQGFVFYFLLLRDVIAAVDASTYGSKMPRANWDCIGNLPVLIPPLEEQHAISNFLDRETAAVDCLLQKQRQLRDLLDEKRFATVEQLTTTGVAPAKLRDTGIDWIGSIPERWSVVKMKFVARLATGHTPSREHPEYWVDCTIPWFTLADVWQIRDGRREYVSETAHKISEVGLLKSAAVLLPAGTVMVSRTASVGFSAITETPMATSQDFVNWVCGPRILPDYLLFVFRSMRNEFQRLTMGSTHQTIYMPDVAEFVTPLPPIEEQSEIVRAVRQETAQIDRLVDSISRQTELLKEYRSALISAAVTGQIDVRNYRPQDAIASIRTRKATPEFRRTVLAAEIVHQLHRHPTFGHVKFQKILHLVQYYADLHDFDSHYSRHAAGPLDRKLLLSVEGQMRRAQWYDCKREAGRYSFAPMRKAGTHARYFERYYAGKRAKFQKVIDLCRELDTERCEIVSTLFGAWNDLLLAGQTVCDDAIVDEVLTRWHPAKDRINEVRWRKALGWMRKNDLVPVGKGKPIKVRTEEAAG